jgi:predicted dehydrogenase
MSDHINNKHVLIVGAGHMAQAYYEVLNGLNIETTIVGRSEGGCKKFFKVCGVVALEGGLKRYVSSVVPEYAINTSTVECLAETTLQLMDLGVRHILLEKPGAVNKEELKAIIQKANDTQTKIYIAYNRRYYASTLKAQEIIKQDGGVTSFHFEFTEWSHAVLAAISNKEVLKHWVIANSSHMIDLAFHLGGDVKEIQSFTNGSLDWHPSASNFSGSGISVSEALFSYKANWESPGRWMLEVMTAQHKLIFCPVERLQIQELKSVKLQEVKDVDYRFDETYKPGLYLQTEAFLKGDVSILKTLQQQVESFDLYYDIANY